MTNSEVYDAILNELIGRYWEKKISRTDLRTAIRSASFEYHCYQYGFQTFAKLNYPQCLEVQS